MFYENESLFDEIAILKQLLSQTDYQAIKYSEGEMSKEDFLPIREKRQSWRDKINELESRMNSTTK